MTNLEIKATQVQDLFLEISDNFKKFQTNHQIFCLKDCGKCCTYNDIQCSVLELIPFALYIARIPELNPLAEKIRSNPESKFCHLYQSTSDDNKKGFCQYYQYRPSICRIFGAYAAKNKYGKYSVSTCDLLKEQREKSSLGNDEYQNTPMFWTEKLKSIDPHLAEDKNHINISLLKALDIVDTIHYYQQLENLNE